MSAIITNDAPAALSVFSPVISTCRKKTAVRLSSVMGPEGKKVEVAYKRILTTSLSLKEEVFGAAGGRQPVRRSSTLPDPSRSIPSRSNSLTISRPVSKIEPAESAHPFDAPHVYSPFAHLYTTSIPADTATIRIHPEEFADNPDMFTTWTYLRTLKGASHWSCRAKGFWPLRVVLDGPGGEDMVPKLAKPPAVDDTSDPLPTSTREATFQAKSPKKKSERKSDPTVEEAADEAPTSPTSPSEVPTILASVKQLGQSFVKSLPPSVGTSIEKLPQTFSSGIGNISRSWSTWAAPNIEHEVEEFEEERRREKEERRARRARREARRAAEREAPGASEYEMGEETREERRARRRWEKSRAD